MYRGLKKNQHYTWLIFATQNIKNMSIKKEKVNGKPITKTTDLSNIINILKKYQKIYI